MTLHENQNGKDLESFESFEEVWDAFQDQMRYYAGIHAVMDNTTDRLWEEYMEEPLTSVMGCTLTVLERGKSIKRAEPNMILPVMRQSAPPIRATAFTLLRSLCSTIR
ncbi:hypothetical protein CRH03_01630 [Clostridium sp. HMb25]|nr:hypothetical protein CRH03_01630 [Clostridium sp. HMb25]